MKDYFKKTEKLIEKIKNGEATVTHEIKINGLVVEPVRVAFTTNSEGIILKEEIEDAFIFFGNRVSKYDFPSMFHATINLEKIIKTAQEEGRFFVKIIKEQNTKVIIEEAKND